MVLTRDFTVAVFVVRKSSVLMHKHPKLGLWLPPGGHIEPNELPDEAAHREVLEEAEIRIELLADPLTPQTFPGQPVQLTRPAGIQVEHISPDHQHIDLIYFARQVGDDEPHPDMEWMSLDSMRTRDDIVEEVLAWAERAVAAFAEPGTG